MNTALRNTPNHYKFHSRKEVVVQKRKFSNKMYVTRPLSMYKRNPSALSSAPPEGSNSGILIMQDEEVDLTCCFCCSKIDFVKDLPFPQNKNLTVSYTTSTADGQTTNSSNQVIFIPVLNQPLSSNRYHVIERQGKHKGYV